LLASLIGFALFHFYKLRAAHEEVSTNGKPLLDINRLSISWCSRVADQRHAANQKSNYFAINAVQTTIDHIQLGNLKLLQDSIQQGLQSI